MLKLLVITTGILFVYADTTAGDLEPNAGSLDNLIQQVRRLDSVASPDDHAAYEAIIQNLKRLRDRDSWPVINSAVSLGEIRNTRWQSEPNEEGFRQSLSFVTGSGQWHSNSRSLPMSFSWQIESNQIRLSYYAPFKNSFNYQIIDKTFQYSIQGDTLTMQSEDVKLKWTRVLEP